MQRPGAHRPPLPPLLNRRGNQQSRPGERVLVAAGLDGDQEAQVEAAGQLHNGKQEESLPRAIHMLGCCYVDEHSRVKVEEMSEEGYINANWIPLPQDRRLIITQGPL